MEAMECSTPPEEGEEAREQGSWLEGLLTFRDVGCSVLRHLDAVDFARLSISSRHLRDVLSPASILWEDRCRHYGVKSLDGWPVSSYHELYTGFLHKYGHLAGMWSGNVPSVGSCLLVEITPPGIYGSAIIPQRLNGDALKGAIFEIVLAASGQVSVRCTRPGRSRPNEPAGQLELLPLSTACRCHAGFLALDGPDAFDFHCVEACQQNILELHSRLLAAVSTIPTSHNPAMLTVSALAPALPSAAIPEITPAIRELQVLQYIVSHQALWAPGSCVANQGNVTRFTRLVVPSGRHRLEGLWKGTYGGHGLEIVTLKLQPDCVTMRATKVTGDPNVPHSQETLCFFLDQPISPAGDALPQAQPEDTFEVPHSYAVDVDPVAAAALKPVGRYRGGGQAARTGFLEPRWTNVQVVEVEGGMLAVLWLTLHSCSLYTRLSLPLNEAPSRSIARGRGGAF